MKLSTLFSILAPTVATVQAGCYNGGRSWAPDQNLANDKAKELCDDKDLAGSFDGNKEKYSCVEADTPGKKFEFTVGNLNDAKLWLNPDDCKLRLSNEINGCGHGGESEIAGWFFRADPNDGYC